MLEMADVDRDISEVVEVEVDREVKELSSSAVKLAHVEGKEVWIGGEEDNRGEKVDSFLPGEDEWEGIERSELEKRFDQAMKYMTSSTGVEALARLGSDAQMDLYGLHKVATEGPCYESQPLPLKVVSWTRWNAWQKLGSMTPVAAMEQYIILLSKCIPGWMEENAGEHAKLDRNNHSSEQAVLCREYDVLNSSSQAQSSNVKQRNLDIQASIEADNATGVSKVFEQGLTSTFLLNLLFPTRGAMLSLTW
ncbi:hypothetical protein HPP92_008188 [Vanilla planifolia]|nr:hypothetical protein HPP92_008188 [Vanilla planifolia]